MLTSSRYLIVYPNPTRGDSADVPRDLGALVAAVEQSAMYGQGTLAARPTSSGGSPGIQGRFYMATDLTPHVLYYDFGTGWDSVGAIAAGSIGTTQLADRSVTTIKIALDAVTSAELATNAVDTVAIQDGAVTSAKIASSLFPSGGAGAATEAFRALGTTAGTAVAGNDSRLSDQRVPTDNSVTTVKLQDSSVTSAKIVDGTIVDADISAAAAIAPSKISGTAVITTDSRLAMARIGVLSARPAANTVAAGTHYFATDQVADYISDGSAWTRTTTPAGIIAMTALSTAASGWILLQGQSWPSTTGIYADLFALFGAAVLPDFRRYVPAGWSSGDPDFGTLMAAVGAASATLSAAQLAHHHSVVVPSEGMPDMGTADFPGGADGTYNTGGVIDDARSAVSLIQPTRVVNFQAKL